MAIVVAREKYSKTNELVISECFFSSLGFSDNVDKGL